MNRFFQLLLVVSTLGFSWLAMMAVHELGHVLQARASGGAVSAVVLHPLAISRTDYASNPHPLFVAWGGVAWGSLLPLSLLAVVHFAARPFAWLARFFTGFCLIANGAYLAAGSVFPGGGDDAGVLLHHGAKQWQLLAFGLPAAAAGLYLWNGLGPNFGLGESRGRVNRRAAVGVAVGLAALVAIELAWSP